MKHLFPLFVSIMILFLSSCSQIEENNDPIIGIWNDKTISSANKSNDNMSHEWVFNDAYLGRYQQYDNNVLNYKTDFKWSVEDGVYTISYPGTDMPANTVSMKGSLEGDMLEFINGSLLALRE